MSIFLIQILAMLLKNFKAKYSATAKIIFDLLFKKLD